MATMLKETDAVVIGVGWTGAILARELTKAGLHVVGLERGAKRTPREDFTIPSVRDDLKYAVHKAVPGHRHGDRDLAASPGNSATHPPPRLVPAGHWAGGAEGTGTAHLAAAAFDHRCACISRSATARTPFRPR
jgi:choline dehydrogenase-like flavoprotein